MKGIERPESDVLDPYDELILWSKAIGEFGEVRSRVRNEVTQHLFAEIDFESCGSRTACGRLIERDACAGVGEPITAICYQCRQHVMRNRPAKDEQ